MEAGGSRGSRRRYRRSPDHRVRGSVHLGGRGVRRARCGYGSDRPGNPCEPCPADGLSRMDRRRVPARVTEGRTAAVLAPSRPADARRDRARHGARSGGIALRCVRDRAAPLPVRGECSDPRDARSDVCGVRASRILRARRRRRPDGPASAGRRLVSASRAAARPGRVQNAGGRADRAGPRGARIRASAHAALSGDLRPDGVEILRHCDAPAPGAGPGVVHGDGTARPEEGICVRYAARCHCHGVPAGGVESAGDHRTDEHRPRSARGGRPAAGREIHDLTQCGRGAGVDGGAAGASCGGPLRSRTASASEVASRRAHAAADVELVRCTRAQRGPGAGGLAALDRAAVRGACSCG